MTPLHYAVQQKNRTMTQILLKADININLQDDMGNTPLLLAVNIGSLAMVTLLVDKGADPFIENKKGSSPFLISLTDKAVAVLSKFQGHSGFRTLSWYNKTRALHWASERGSPATLRLYLDQMPKTPQAQLQMASAIHTAAKACRADLVKVLLSNDFEVDALDTGGNTALLLACQTGRYSNFENDYQRAYLCETLILAGANMVVRNYHNHTPFSIAEAHRDYELMALLLHYTLKLNKVNSGIESAQLMQSTMFIYKDEQFCNEARSLIGGKTIAPELIRDAVKREEWDFVMTCIGGHFIGKRDLGIEWGGQAWGLCIDRLDELRFLCVQRDREMVRYVFEKIRRDDDDTIPQPKTHVGHRNLESELNQSKSRLKELIWAGEMKSFRETLSGIVRNPNASEDLTFEVDGDQAFGSDDLEAFSLYALQRQIGSAGRDLGQHQSIPEHTGQNSPDDILGSLAINLKASPNLRESSQQSNLNRPLYLPELSDLDMVGWRYLDAKRTIAFLHQQVEISYILMKAWCKEFDKSTNSWKLDGIAVWMWAQGTLSDIEKHCEQAADSLRLLTAYFQKRLDTQPEEEEETWRSLHQAASSLIPHLNELGKEISWASDQLGKSRAKKLGTKGLKDLCRKHIGRAIVMRANFLL
jgi:ankyrin repeat protein